jgi:hypothetical protein
MLFILVMQIFNLIIDTASQLGLLGKLQGRWGAPRTSLYAGDATVLIKPCQEEFGVMHELFASSEKPRSFTPTSQKTLPC